MRSCILNGGTDSPFDIRRDVGERHPGHAGRFETMWMLPRCCRPAPLPGPGAKIAPPVLQAGMDVHAALEEVRRWCIQQVEAGDPDRLEVDCHATVWITIGESAPPWRVRWERRCSSGASAPIAQLR